MYATVQIFLLMKYKVSKLILFLLSKHALFYGHYFNASITIQTQF